MIGGYFLKKKYNDVLKFMNSLGIKYLKSTDHPFYSVFVCNKPCGRSIRFFNKGKKYNVLYNGKLDALCDLIFDALVTCERMCRIFINPYQNVEELKDALRDF